jgi:hypothetical protein
VSTHTRDIHEEKRASKAYLKSRLKMLRDAGISGPLASRVANAEVRALTAVFDFFETLDELHDAGKPNVAGAVWVMFFSMLLIELPKVDRREFMEAVLRLADEIDKKSEAAE